ncbi:MAG: hypothetical protein H7210_02370 [Pyrinomonadaceae bacterium]|nr:hypothetical protein [Phycisphaerales bacterium]
MIFQFIPEYTLLVRSTLARHVHSTWLSRALRRGSSLPRIPTRLVSRGGFDREMSTRQGREWATDWWEQTLSRDDLDG